MPSLLDIPAILKAYQMGATTRMVARQFGCSAGYVSKLLKAHGQRARHRRPRRHPCAHCQTLTSHRRFCSPACYHAHIHNPHYHQWRQGQRLARAAVLAAGFPLERGHIVHHVDNNNRHNDVTNLWVFASHGDHMSFHRLGRELQARAALWKGGDARPR